MDYSYEKFEAFFFRRCSISSRSREAVPPPGSSQPRQAGGQTRASVVRASTGGAYLIVPSPSGGGVARESGAGSYTFLRFPCLGWRCGSNCLGLETWERYSGPGSPRFFTGHQCVWYCRRRGMKSSVKSVVWDQPLTRHYNIRGEGNTNR